ncbi:MAG: FAD binding domain-containing protein [Pseudomonadota bacterium]
MRLPKFEYLEPAGIEEASKIILENPKNKVLAGGTDLLVNMKHRVEQPPTLINLKKIPGLDYIKPVNGEIRIGTLTPLKKLCTSPVIARKLPALATAASVVGSYHHQTMGTIGGNICQQNRCKYYNQSQWWRSSRPLCFKAGGDICHVVNKEEVCYSHYCGDAAAVLLVLEAQAVLQTADGSRTVPVDSLFSGNGRVPLNLNPGEILTEIIIPQAAAEGRAVYLKFANRASIDFPIVGAAVWISSNGPETRIAFTSVDRRPVRAVEAEACLKDKGLDQGAIETAAGLAAKTGQPTTASLYSPGYKRKLMGLLVKSAFKNLLGR